MRAASDDAFSNVKEITLIATPTTIPAAVVGTPPAPVDVADLGATTHARWRIWVEFKFGTDSDLVGVVEVAATV